MMKRKNILFPVLMGVVLIVLAVSLYAFTYHTINKSFFAASVNNTVETMTVIRDLGIKKVDHNLWDIKINLKNMVTDNASALLDGTFGERVEVLAQLPLIHEGIDHWFCLPNGEAVTSAGSHVDWREIPGLAAAFAKDDAFVIDPYFDNEGNYILTVAAPVRKDGKVAGVLLTRLNGYCLSNWIEDLQFSTGHGLGYIITGDGRNIATSRRENYDWITSSYNSQTLFAEGAVDEDTMSVAALERMPLDGKSGWGTYQWEGSTNYLVYAPMQEANWAFFVGFYGNILDTDIRKVASESTASSQTLVLLLFVFVAVLGLYAHYNLRKEKGYVQELLQQNREIQKQAEDLFISEERFRVALERTSSIIFEYNLKTGSITNFRTTKEVEYRETSLKNLKDELIAGASFDDVSLRTLENALHDMGKGMSKNECTLKAFLPDGTVNWYRVSISAITNQAHLVTRVIGILEDITKEKLAELDPLTGIFNKKVIVEQVKQRLQQMQVNDTCAFLMFDIDNFKDINSTYGHPFGDKVITQIASILKNVFAQDAIVGRFGGDEFCVFCYGEPSMQALKQSLDIVCEQLHEKFSNDYLKIAITYSCGVTFCSGRCYFEKLYREADNALYKAKHAGKNQYVFVTMDRE